jgi:hypothetical protein
VSVDSNLSLTDRVHDLVEDARGVLLHRTEGRTRWLRWLVCLAPIKGSEMLHARENADFLNIFLKRSTSLDAERGESCV